MLDKRGENSIKKIPPNLLIGVNPNFNFLLQNLKLRRDSLERLSFLTRSMDMKLIPSLATIRQLSLHLSFQLLKIFSLLSKRILDKKSRSSRESVKFQMRLLSNRTQSKFLVPSRQTPKYLSQGDL